MATTGHENESINVGGLKTSLQALKTKYIDDLDSGVSSLDSRVDTLEEAVGSGGSIDSRIENAINGLDASVSQTAGTDGLALSITETDGKITTISGSISSGTYDIAGSASTAKTEVIGGATSSGNTLKKLEDRVSPLESAIGSGGSIDTRISNAINALDSSASQTAGADGLALSVTETDGKITSISGSIASGTYDAAGSASTVKTELLGDAASDYNTLGKLEDKIQAEVTARVGAVNGETTRAQAAESALQSQYNALTQSDIIVGALPASGTKNRIYRVPGSSSYSDYMWNGSSWVLMATYNNAIDNEPTHNSNNLVKSGGVKTYVDNSISDDHSIDYSLYNKILYHTQRGDGKWHYDPQGYGSILIPRKDLGSYICIGTTGTGEYCQCFFLKDDQNIVEGEYLRLCDNTDVITIRTTNTTYNIFIPKDCGYLCLYRSNWSDQVFVNTVKLNVYSPNQSIVELNSCISIYEEKKYDISGFISNKILYHIQYPDGVWHSSPSYGTILFPAEYFGLCIKIGTTSTGEYCQYWFLTDNNNITEGAVPHYCKNTEKITITTTNTTNIEYIPSDCKYIAIYVSNWDKETIKSNLYLQNLPMIDATRLAIDEIFNKNIDENNIYPCYLSEEQFLTSLKFTYIPSSTFSPNHSFYDNVIIAHISDVHADTTNYMNFINFFNQHKELINTAIVTGDIADVYKGDGIETISNESELEDGLTIYKVVGNHESYCTSSKSEIYDMFNVETNTGELYYNIDYSEQKIKLIVLNQYDYDNSISSEPAKSRSGRWTQEQIDWFIQQLQSALTNEYAVIIALHDAWELGVPTRNDMSFYQENNIPIDDSRATSSPIIAEIVDAFQFGKSLNKTYSFSDSSYTVSINVSFASRGSFITYLCGHYHIDRIGYSSLYPYQLVAGIQATVIEGISRSDSEAYWSSMYDTPRRLETVTANSINLYSVDTKNRLLKVAKIGSNLTYKLKPRMFAVFKY